MEHDRQFANEEEFRVTATSVLRRLHHLNKEMQSVRTNRPFHTLKRLNSMTAELSAMDSDYWRCVDYAYVKMSSEVTGGTGGALASGLIGHNFLAASLPYFLRLESLSQRANSTLDSKRSLAIAMLSIYVSGISVILGVLGVGLSYILAPS